MFRKTRKDDMPDTPDKLYNPNMKASAYRHLEAAKRLYGGGNRKDVAGYLYGVAAECAVKAMMLDCGMRPGEGRSKDDPFFAHFPQLRTMLLDLGLNGRRSVSIRSLILHASFMQYWSTDMRYCDGKEIEPDWIERWADQARQAISAIGT
jgi:hypothetical protein